jgi:hypothetical protein
LDQLEQLQLRIAPLKTALLDHPVYREIDRLASLHIFMEHHVFAVWDFMSLLKTLQRLLTCVQVPWLPTVNPIGCRFINEIVVAEESDVDGRGAFVSHFELYRQAMVQCGAKTAAIDDFVDDLRQGRSLQVALNSNRVSAPARHFVRRTFEIIEEGQLCAIASAFTFGREDLLPGLFQRIVDRLNVETSGGLEIFRYYLHRHIGLDGEEHGPMAGQLMRSLCGVDANLWNIAEQAAMTSLEARLELWDGIYSSVCQSKESGDPLSQHR